ncbi:MAG: hypothetical protein H7Y32_00020 [Chloroflexales bacterium]|nr:hypothetical protein [Chloroflexales bacterium]
MILYGTAHQIGAGITTAQIIAPAQRGDGDPAWLAAHCLASVDPALAERVAEGDLLVAAQDFGAGEDAEIAVLALQALGFAAIICGSCAPGLREAADTYGLPVLIAPDAAVALAGGQVVRVDLAGGSLTDRTSGARFSFTPAAPALIAAVRRAALLRRMRGVVEQEGFDG